MLIRFELDQLSLFAELLCTDNLLFLCHKRHNAHGGEPCPFLDGIVIPQGADGDIPDGVDLPQKLRIHAEHAPPVGKEKDLALRRAGIMRALHGSHGRHAQRRLFLMDLARIFFPDKNGLLANIEQFGNIFFRNDMAAFESGTFKTVTHGCDIMAQLHANSRFNRYFFHFCFHLSISGFPRNQNHILGNGIR